VQTLDLRLDVVLVCPVHEYALWLFAGRSLAEVQRFASNDSQNEIVGIDPMRPALSYLLADVALAFAQNGRINARVRA
jgi:hypothetical protein